MLQVTNNGPNQLAILINDDIASLTFLCFNLYNTHLLLLHLTGSPLSSIHPLLNHIHRDNASLMKQKQRYGILRVRRCLCQKEIEIRREETRKREDSTKENKYHAKRAKDVHERI